jgi:hypothetical protein
VTGSPRTAVEGRPELLGQTDTASSLTAYASVALRYEVAPAVSVGAMVLGGTLLPRAEIRFAGRTVANWGAVYGVGMLGLTVRVK